MADANLAIQSRAGAATAGADRSSGVAAGHGVGDAEPSDFQRMLGSGRPAGESDSSMRGSSEDLAAEAGTVREADDQDPPGQCESGERGSAVDPIQIDALLGAAGDALAPAPCRGARCRSRRLCRWPGCVALQAAASGSAASQRLAAGNAEAEASVTAGAGSALPSGLPSAWQGTTAGNAAASTVDAATGDAANSATASGISSLYQGMAGNLEGGGAKTGTRTNMGRGPAMGVAASQAAAAALQGTSTDPLLQGAAAQATALQDARSLTASTLDAAVTAALSAMGERSPDAGLAASDAGGGNLGAIGSSTQATMGAPASHRGAGSHEATGAASLAPSVNTPVGSLAWRDQIAGRVSWMIDNGEQQASLRLSPENLGPLEVRIAVREGEASVWFGASQAETRAALEQAMPRLREMLAGSGLSLTNSGVFSHSPRDPCARPGVRGGTGPRCT